MIVGFDVDEISAQIQEVGLDHFLDEVRERITDPHLESLVLDWHYARGLLVDYLRSQGVDTCGQG